MMQPGTPRPGREGREALGQSWGLVPWVCAAGTKAWALDPAALGHCTFLGLGAGVEVEVVVVRMAPWSPLFPQALPTNAGHPQGTHREEPVSPPGCTLVGGKPAWGG